FGLVPRRLSLSPPIRCAAPPPPAIYTLSLHDALPIYGLRDAGHLGADVLVRHPADPALRPRARVVPDRRGRADGARAADRHVGGPFSPGPGTNHTHQRPGSDRDGFQSIGPLGGPF